MESMEGFNQFKVGNLPTLFYIPNFITDDDETSLLNNIYKAPVSKWKSLKNRRLQNWGGIVHEKGLLPQELPPWLTKVTQKIFQESSLFPTPMNHVLINEYLPNQGIMFLALMQPHQDGPAYFPVVAILSLGSPVVMDFTPHYKLISNVDDKDCNENFEVETDNKLFHVHKPFSILLMPRSLLIFKDEAYSDYLHSINDNSLQCYSEAVNKIEALNCDLESKNARVEGGSHDHGVIERKANRVSLTCRLVPKVVKHFFKH